MGRHRYPARSSYRSGTDIGHEMARRHIEAARRLTEELGGTDQDVKQYFFALSPRSLNSLLDAYEQKHGREPRLYAEQTMRKWRAGTVQMSGTVAERLFSLLPPRMPLTEKYKLVETLWSHVGPRSKRTVSLGLDAGLDHVLDAVRQHMDDVVVHYTIPSSLEKRFNWLAASDARVKQSLLNHFQQHEKTLVVEGARLQVPVMLEHLRSNAGANTHRLAQILKIGNHELELAVDKNASGVRLMEPYVERPRAASPAQASSYEKSTSYRWVLWVAAAMFVLYILSHH
jgi:hypothetical protein